MKKEFYSIYHFACLPRNRIEGLFICDKIRNTKAKTNMDIQRCEGKKKKKKPQKKSGSDLVSSTVQPFDMQCKP